MQLSTRICRSVATSVQTDLDDARTHKDTTQSEHHERTHASEIRTITQHLTESAVKKVSGRVPSFINFIVARPTQAPLCLGDPAKTGV